MMIDHTVPSEEVIHARRKIFGCPYCGSKLSQDKEEQICCEEHGHGTWLDLVTLEPISEFKASGGELIEWYEEPSENIQQ